MDRCLDEACKLTLGEGLILGIVVVLAMAWAAWKDAKEERWP